MKVNLFILFGALCSLGVIWPRGLILILSLIRTVRLWLFPFWPAVLPFRRSARLLPIVNWKVERVFFHPLSGRSGRADHSARCRVVVGH